MDDARVFQIPLWIKVICSVFMWFPLLIPYLTCWYYPKFSIHYSELLLLYIIARVLLGDASCFLALCKVKANIQKLSKSSHWLGSRNSSAENNKETLGAKHIGSILHLVVIPIYQENATVLETTLKALSTQNLPMIIGLALEEQDRDCNTKYNQTIRKFENHFLSIIKTIHPSGIKDEIQGRGSNCDYCVRRLVKHYEESDLKAAYNHVMVTVCDVDTVWSANYFLYLEYVCEKNGMTNFDSIVYTPVITNLKYFQSYNVLSNWLSMNRLWYFQGHLRFFGMVRCLINAFHIPLHLLQKINYFDVNYNCDDVRMGNKIALSDESNVFFQQIYLPCDNQTPTGSSLSETFVLLWRQTIRWNLSMQEIYYLAYRLSLNMQKVNRHRNFQSSTWKILCKIMDNYEGLFFYPLCFITNGIFWLIYSNFLHQSYHSIVIYHLLCSVLPLVMIIQAMFIVVLGLFMFTINDENTKGSAGSTGQKIFFLIGAAIAPYFITWFIGITLILAWLKTLKGLTAHGDSAAKLH